MKLSLTHWLSKLPLPATQKWPQGAWDVEAFKQDDVAVELFAPRNHDYQTPHTQDEIYVIVRGSGTFELEGTPIDFESGDLLIVPAGKSHRFTKFTADLATWVIFWGPQKVIAA